MPIHLEHPEVVLEPPVLPNIPPLPVHSPPGLAYQARNGRGLHLHLHLHLAYRLLHPRAGGTHDAVRDRRYGTGKLQLPAPCAVDSAVFALTCTQAGARTGKSCGKLLHCGPSQRSAGPACSYKRVKGRSHTAEKRKAIHPPRPHATSQPSRFSHTPRLSTESAHN